MVDLFGGEQQLWEENQRLQRLLESVSRSLLQLEGQLAAALSLDAENVEGVARAMLSAEHAAFMTLHPELKEEQFTYQIAYFKGLQGCALAAIKHLREQAGLPVED